MRTNLHDFAAAIATTVIESDDFSDAVASQMDAEIESAVEKAVENLNIDDKADKDTVENLERQIEDMQVLYDNLKETMLEVDSENQELKTRINSLESHLCTLVKVVENTHKVLRKIPFFGKKFV